MFVRNVLSFLSNVIPISYKGEVFMIFILNRKEVYSGFSMEELVGLRIFYQSKE